MFYYSTGGRSSKADFREATIKGQAPDKGLYFPEIIPQLPAAFINEIDKYSYEDIGMKVMSPYVGETIPAVELKNIISETVNFPFPLVKVTEQMYSLELYHGPTMAFKDVGARFMSRCLGFFVKDLKQEITVLVATSGDTGGAVASGFYNVEGINVVILYPSGKVSPVQELQLTGYGKNIQALEIVGNFDDCQQLVKTAFADEELQKYLFLTSANSINIARWLPQQLYYFFGFQQWPDKKVPPVMSVPSGNFGNLASGMLAKSSGLPISHFIAACNENDVLSGYLSGGAYKPKTSTPTISNAMDVGDPSNFVRILQIFHNEFKLIRQNLSAYKISDDETRSTIKDIYGKWGYLPDPHGAVGFAALQRFLQDKPLQKGIVLETAHPVKFREEVENILHHAMEVPVSLNDLLSLPKKSIKMKPDFIQLKSYLLDRN